MNTFKCSDCRKTITNTDKSTSGYGIYPNGDKVCFSCCAYRDLASMRDTGKITLYLSGNSQIGYKLGNWPGTLSLRPASYRVGKHNIARTRIDVWFVLDGFWWHGIQYGDFSQLCYCKKTKQVYNGSDWEHPIILDVDYPRDLMYEGLSKYPK